MKKLLLTLTIATSTFGAPFLFGMNGSDSKTATASSAAPATATAPSVEPRNEGKEVKEEGEVKAEDAATISSSAPSTSISGSTTPFAASSSSASPSVTPVVASALSSSSSPSSASAAPATATAANSLAASASTAAPSGSTTQPSASSSSASPSVTPVVASASSSAPSTSVSGSATPLASSTPSSSNLSTSMPKALYVGAPRAKMTLKASSSSATPLLTPLTRVTFNQIDRLTDSNALEAEVRKNVEQLAQYRIGQFAQDVTSYRILAASDKNLILQSDLKNLVRLAEIFDIESLKSSLEATAKNPDTIGYVITDDHNPVTSFFNLPTLADDKPVTIFAVQRALDQEQKNGNFANEEVKCAWYALTLEKRNTLNQTSEHSLNLGLISLALGTTYGNYPQVITADEFAKSANKNQFVCQANKPNHIIHLPDLTTEPKNTKQFVFNHCTQSNEIYLITIRQFGMKPSGKFKRAYQWLSSSYVGQMFSGACGIAQKITMPIRWGFDWERKGLETLLSCVLNKCTDHKKAASLASDIAKVVIGIQNLGLICLTPIGTDYTTVITTIASFASVLMHLVLYADIINVVLEWAIEHPYKATLVGGAIAAIAVVGVLSGVVGISLLDKLPTVIGWPAKRIIEQFITLLSSMGIITQHAVCQAPNTLNTATLTDAQAAEAVEVLKKFTGLVNP